jgi:hypothetical protein
MAFPNVSRSVAHLQQAPMGGRAAPASQARTGRPHAVSAATAPQARTGRSRAIATAMMIGLVMPIYVRLPFESPLITVMRGVLLALFVPALLVLIRGVGTGQRQLRASDLFVALTCVWVWMSFAVNSGVGVSAVSGSLIVLEFSGGYLVVRAYFSSRSDVQQFVTSFGKAVIFLVCVALFDHLNGRNLFNDTVASLFGLVNYPSSLRNGLLRATATLEHPILFGTLCTFAYIVFYYGKLTGLGRTLFMALSAFGCVLAMSSAPLLALFLGTCLILYDRILQSYRWRWKVFLGIGALMFGLLFLIKSDPFATLIRNFTIDPQTGFYRLMIWDYAGHEVLQNPYFGVNRREWAKGTPLDGSIDTIWLAFALAYGIPASILLALSLLTSMRQKGTLAPDRYLDPYLLRMRRGLSITISLAIFIGFTVHFWGVMLTFLGILAGLRTTIEESLTRQSNSLRRRQRQPQVQDRTRPPHPSHAVRM